MSIRTFTITGADERPHEYSVIPHPPSEGMEILWTLIGLGGEPLARLAQSVISDALQAAGEEEGDIIQKDDEGNLSVSARMTQILGDVDLESIDLVGAAKDLRVVMASLPMTDTIYKLLRYTTRDGEPLDTRKSRVKFDQAYTANYTEMLNAAGRVIAINGFLPQFVTSMLD